MRRLFESSLVNWLFLEDLAPRQRAIVRGVLARCGAVSTRPSLAASLFGQWSASQRATFVGITHALLNTHLVDSRDGHFAQIHIDYRFGLLHLWPANSDVRAQGNHQRHADRWSQFALALRPTEKPRVVLRVTVGSGNETYSTRMKADFCGFPCNPNHASGILLGAMTPHLAQINIARLIAPIDDPKIAEFVAQLEPINALADGAPGFVWRLQSESGNATDIAYSDDPFVIVNISVWESLEALRNFAYKSDHARVFRDRAKWFEKMDKPSYCLWWIPAGHIPTVAEGRGRLEHYQQHGATPYSFWFSQHFPLPADEDVLV